MEPHDLIKKFIFNPKGLHAEEEPKAKNEYSSFLHNLRSDSVFGKAEAAAVEKVRLGIAMPEDYITANRAFERPSILAPKPILPPKGIF